MDYFKSETFQKHRKNICDYLEQLPTVESPNGWLRKGYFSVGVFTEFSKKV